jgi:hypothetical protein
VKKIYQGLTGLEISFQCALPFSTLNALAVAKEVAKTSGQSVPIIIGNNKLPIIVSSTGTQGYAYSFDIEGTTWHVAHSDNPAHWNIHLSVSSKILAPQDYSETKKITIEFLNQLNPIFLNDGKRPLERISRFHYSFDFNSEDFIPDVNRFISPNRCTKKYQGNILNIPPFYFIRGEPESNIPKITIGELPNRQIVFCNKNKSAENYWWDIWQLNKKEFKGNIWRIEITTGKKELNKWNCRRFGDLEQKIEEIIISILNSIYYSDENNKFKMAYFWQDSVKSLQNPLIPGVLGSFPSLSLS